MIVSTILILSLLACLIAGIYISRNVRLTEYTSFRAKGTFSDILFSLLASLVGGWMFFGLGAVGYEAGIVGFIFGIGYAIGLIFIGKNVSKIKAYMNKFKADTLDDFIGKRYGKATQFIITLVNMTFFLAVLA